MSWSTTSPVDAARKRGIADARAGKAMRCDPHWNPEFRREYKAAYDRTSKNMKSQ
jgi:hypothetical protein